MSTEKNTPPKGYLIAIAVIAGFILFYFILTMLFPDLFHGMSQGKAAPVHD